MPVLSATRLSVTRGSRRRASNRLTFSPLTTAYLANVEAADGEPLEDPIYNAMGTFAEWRIPLGGACCLMTGPRTLAGALVPMVGVAPTGVNLVEGDYDRARVQLDGTSKYINTNVANNTSGMLQNDRHAVALLAGNYAVPDTAPRCLLASGPDAATNVSVDAYRTNTAGNSFVATCSSSWSIQALATAGQLAAGAYGVFRIASGSFTVLESGRQTTANIASAAPSGGIIGIGSRSADGVGLGAFPIGGYSCGPYTDPTELDTRMAAAVNAITTALA